VPDGVGLAGLAHGQASASLTGFVTDCFGSGGSRRDRDEQERGDQRGANGHYGWRGALPDTGAGRREYTLKVQKSGFQLEVREGIHLVVGQEAHVDLRLEVGDLRQRVVVTEDAPMVNTSTRDVSGLVGSIR